MIIPYFSAVQYQRYFLLPPYPLISACCFMLAGSIVSAAATLEDEGCQALKDGIPEVAAVRFQNALSVHTLDQAAKARLTALLLESFVRSGEYSRVLEITQNLDDATVHDILFWKGLALSGMGEFAAAEADLLVYSKADKAKYHDESLLNLARVQANKGDLRAAVVTLNLIVPSSRQWTRAKIDQCQIFLAMEKFADARNILPPRKGLSKLADFEVGLLHARLLLAEGKAEMALEAFSSLRKFMVQQESADGIKSRMLFDGLHLCIIGEARARHASGKVIDATDNLLAFVQNFPNSPYLSDAFGYMLEWLPTNGVAEDDPVRSRIMNRLTDWSPMWVDQPIKLLGAHEDSVLGMALSNKGANPVPPLHAYALHARIVIRGQQTDDASAQAVRSLLFAMQAQHPDHPLTYESWLLWAKIALARFDKGEAMRALEYLSQQAPRDTQTNANLLLAKEAFEREEYDKAQKAFRNAAENMRAESRREALFQSAIAALNQNDSTGFGEILLSAEPELKVNLELEQALFAGRQDPHVAIGKLDQFLMNHPTHPRVDEARIALAQYALRVIPPNLGLANSQLLSIPETTLLKEPLALTWCQLSFAEVNYAALVQRCRSFLADYPSSVMVGAVKLQLGVALYQTGDYGDARMVLQELAAENAAFFDAATMYAARAAARSGTPQSIIEAGRLFDAIATSGSPLGASAIVEKARFFIESKVMENVREAEKDLSSLLGEIKEDSPIFITASIIKIETLYALGAVDPSHYSLALKLQEKLLQLSGVVATERYRIYYYRGLTYEQLGDRNEALNAYYRVIEATDTKAQEAWEYVDRCAFNALAILEKNQAWESTMALAKKMAAAGGPSAAEFLERARRISLEHFILDD